MKNANISMPVITVIGLVLTCWLAVELDSNRVAEAYKAGWKTGSQTTIDYFIEVPTESWLHTDLDLLFQMDSLEYCKDKINKLH